MKTKYVQKCSTRQFHFSEVTFFQNWYFNYSLISQVLRSLITYPINFSSNNKYISFSILKADFEYHLCRPLFILPLNKRIRSHMRLTTMQSIILLLNGFKSMRHHIIMQKMLIQLSICQMVSNSLKNTF